MQEIERTLELLGKEYAGSSQANFRKGGLIGLAAATLGLNSMAHKWLHMLLPPILQCFPDQDSRVRYYSCEALYNVAKVTRSRLLPHLNEIFQGLCRLCADIDQGVKNGAQLLDRLLKDIVASDPSFEVDSFVPVLRQHLNHTSSHVRHFLIGSRPRPGPRHARTRRAERVGRAVGCRRCTRCCTWTCTRTSRCSSRACSPCSTTPPGRSASAPTPASPSSSAPSPPPRPSPSTTSPLYSSAVPPPLSSADRSGPTGRPRVPPPPTQTRTHARSPAHSRALRRSSGRSTEPGRPVEDAAEGADERIRVALVWLLEFVRQGKQALLPFAGDIAAALLAAGGKGASRELAELCAGIDGVLRDTIAAQSAGGVNVVDNLDHVAVLAYPPALTPAQPPRPSPPPPRPARLHAGGPGAGVRRAGRGAGRSSGRCTRRARR